jgi:hypothetical protein
MGKIVYIAPGKYIFLVGFVRVCINFLIFIQNHKGVFFYELFSSKQNATLEVQS